MVPAVTKPLRVSSPLRTLSVYKDLMDRRIPPGYRPRLSDPFALFESSALPYRITEEGMMICLITSRNKKRWVFPKISTQGLGTQDAARKAAAEKAGLSGHLSDAPIGRYRRLKDGQICEVSVYGLEVVQNHEVWEERSLRHRTWVGASGAATMLVKPELQDMLERLRRSPAAYLTA